MSDAQKIPFVRSWDKATQRRLADAQQILGKALPARVVSVDGSIVTVEFLINSVFTLPQVTCPLFGPEYIRYPIQAGDLGVVFAADAHLSGVSGLGGGTADLSAPGNLAALVFFPVGNKTWGAVDPDAVTIYGPNGVVLRDTGSETIFTLTPSGVSVMCRDSWTISTGACTFSLDSGGNYSLIGTVGLIQAPTLTLSDTVKKTTPSTMATAWTALVAYINGHSHAALGAPPSVAYSGPTIAPDA